MTRDHLNVLQYIVDNGSARDTQILYSTNGTFPLTDEILEMWTKFSGLDLSCSIDGMVMFLNTLDIQANGRRLNQIL